MARIMINSRNINDLLPVVQTLAQYFIAKCKAEGIDLIVTSTYRDNEAQDALYKIGRGIIGKKVTNAKGGESFHNYRVALDVVPIIGGKCMWDDRALWNRIGAIGKSVGFEWAGDWVTFKEMPHFQFCGGLSLADFKAGRSFHDIK
jgi:peptidoglycan LD-endopeptidase CwlK